MHGDVTIILDSDGVKTGSTQLFSVTGQSEQSTLVNTTQSLSSDYGWAGQYQKHTNTTPGYSSTIQMGARPYNPNIMRFLTTDPIEGGTPNNYTHPTDPVNQNDLSGMCMYSNAKKASKCLRRGKPDRKVCSYGAKATMLSGSFTAGELNMVVNYSVVGGSCSKPRSFKILKAKAGGYANFAIDKSVHYGASKVTKSKSGEKLS